MPFIPSANAQAIATTQGSNLANLSTPLTALQTAISGGSLAPAAMVDAILSFLATNTFIAVSGGIGFKNSWTDFGSGFYSAAYCKDALGFVHLRGVVKSGTINSPMFTLPAGFRPTASMDFPAVSNAAIGQINIDSSGNVTAQIGTNVYYTLDGITFLAEA